MDNATYYFHEDRRPEIYINFEDKQLRVMDDGDVTINGKSIESVAECKQAIAMLIRSVCSMVR